MSQRSFSRRHLAARVRSGSALCRGLRGHRRRATAFPLLRAVCQRGLGFLGVQFRACEGWGLRKTSVRRDGMSKVRERPVENVETVYVFVKHTHVYVYVYVYVYGDGDVEVDVDVDVYVYVYSYTQSVCKFCTYSSPAPS